MSVSFETIQSMAISTLNSFTIDACFGNSQSHGDEHSELVGGLIIQWLRQASNCILHFISLSTNRTKNFTLDSHSFMRIHHQKGSWWRVSPIPLPKRMSDLWSTYAFSSYRPPYQNIYNAHADLLICFIWHLLGHDVTWVSMYDICVGCTIGLEFLDVMCIYEVLYVFIYVSLMLIWVYRYACLECLLIIGGFMLICTWHIACII